MPPGPSDSAFSYVCAALYSRLQLLGINWIEDEKMRESNELKGFLIQLLWTTWRNDMEGIKSSQHNQARNITWQNVSSSRANLRLLLPCITLNIKRLKLSSWNLYFENLPVSLKIRMSLSLQMQIRQHTVFFALAQRLGDWRSCEDICMALLCHARRLFENALLPQLCVILKKIMLVISSTWLCLFF